MVKENALSQRQSLKEESIDLCFLVARQGDRLPLHRGAKFNFVKAAKLWCRPHQELQNTLLLAADQTERGDSAGLEQGLCPPLHLPALDGDITEDHLIGIGCLAGHLVICHHPALQLAQRHQRAVGTVKHLLIVDILIQFRKAVLTAPFKNGAI